MRGRSRAGSVKSRRRKSATPKRASGTAKPRSSSDTGAESEIARLAHDLNDALERETAASEVLKIISSAQAASVQPVLDTVVSNAARLCRASNATIYLREDDSVVIHAQYGPPGLSPVGTRRPINRDWVTGAAILDAQPIQVADLLNSKDYPAGRELAQRLGHRTTLAIPLLRDKNAIGVIVATRREVHPFSRTQIALLQNFAAQSVIAIENARLLNELRDSLEQQTATADVLRIISSSPGELEQVFDVILANATRLCEANFGTVTLYEGDNRFRWAAMYNMPPAYIAIREREPVLRATPLSPMGRIAATKQLQHIPDGIEDPAYKERDPLFVVFVEQAGARTILGIPMLKDGNLVGTINIFRQEVRPFTDEQIELVQNFAAQAVIAIENARLLNELRQRTEEVVKLNQQLEQRVSDQVGEIERMSRLRRFLPPQVADLIVASGTEKQLESHRREITALFCDLRGFTGFSESSDPEDVMALLRDYHAAIGKIIIKYSGTLERYAGDGVMVVFNDPVPVENPALQAVLMALEMRDAIGALTETWHRWGHDIGFGIGIAHGFATLGTIGFEGRFDYAAIGTVSNVASRLCDEAKPGQILINPRVLTKIENAVTVEPVGEFTLKGIRRPMIAYNVLASSPSKPN
jgi:class 3 adenylate cyclase/putative methionine-R-sulfoxide reductase with GAF domain